MTPSPLPGTVASMELPTIRHGVAIACVSLLLAACGGDTDDDARERGGVRVAPDALVVCTSVPFEPAEFREDGELVGYDIDIMGEVARRLEREVAWVEVEFDELLDSLVDRECDAVVASLASTPERIERVRMVPYLSGTAEDPSQPEGPGREVPDPDAPPIGMAVRQDDAELASDIETTIEAMYADGTMKSLLDQWDAGAFALDSPGDQSSSNDADASA